MNVFAALVAALHGRGVTRLPAVYLRLTRGVSYRAFYEDLVDGCFSDAGPQGRITSALREHYEAVLSRRAVWDQLPLEQLPGHPDMIYAARWVHAQIGLNFAELWEVLRRHLLATYGSDEVLIDLLAYQENLVILPDYDFTRGKAFAVRFDWPAYFARARFQEPGAAYPEPAATPGAEVVVFDDACGTKDEVPLDWHTLQGEDRWLAWLDRVVCGRGCIDRTNFKQLSLRPSRLCIPALRVTPDSLRAGHGPAAT
jgi:hypothetical protein